jgi:hypothetical protein
MAEQVIGTDPQGRESVLYGIHAQDEVLRRNPTRDFIRRYEEGEEFARSIVEYGELETVTDTDDKGNETERQVWVAKQVPKELLKQPSGAAASQSQGQQSGQSNGVDALRARIEDLEREKAELEKAKGQDGGVADVPYDKLSPEALHAEAEKRGVLPKEGSGSGKDGNVVKADLVKALEEHDANS